MSLPSAEEKMPKVGIVVVGYNNLSLARVCFDSLRRLEYPNIRLVYIDNMSRDGSLEILDAEFPEVTTISSGSNAGYSGGNNIGIRHHLADRCDYVLLLNPDTELCNPGFVATLVEFMEANPEVGKCGPRVFLRDMGTVQNTILRFPFLRRRIPAWFAHRLVRHKKSLCETLNTPRECESLNGVCVLVRAAAVLDAGGLDEIMWGYSEEVEWDLQLENAGWRRVFVPVASIVHHQRATGYDATSLASFMQSRNAAYLFRKHGYWLSMLIWIAAKTILAGVRLLAALIRRRSIGEHAEYLRRLSLAFAAVSLGNFASASFGPGSNAAQNGGSPHAVV